MPTSDATRGRLLVLAAVLLWSTSGLFLKSPILAALPALERGPALACYRALFAALFLAPFVRRRNIRWRRTLIPMVLCFASMNLLFVSAMTQTSAAAAIFLQYTSTAWAFLFGFLFLKERIDRGNLFALVLALCGIAWIVAGDFSQEHFIGNLMAVGGGASFAGVMLTLRSLRNEDAVWLIFLNNLFSGLILLPWVFTLDVSFSGAQWSLIGLMGLVQATVPNVLFARGIHWIRTQEAALLTLIEPLLNPLWVWLVWHESANPSTWVGGSLILGGLLIRYLVFSTRASTSMSG